MRSNEKLTQRAFIHARRIEERYPWYVPGWPICQQLKLWCNMCNGSKYRWYLVDQQFILWYNMCNGTQSIFLVSGWSTIYNLVHWYFGATYFGALVLWYTMLWYTGTLVHWCTIFFVSGWPICTYFGTIYEMVHNILGIWNTMSTITLTLVKN